MDEPVSRNRFNSSVLWTRAHLEFGLGRRKISSDCCRPVETFCARRGELIGVRAHMSPRQDVRGDCRGRSRSERRDFRAAASVSAALQSYEIVEKLLYH